MGSYHPPSQTDNYYFDSIGKALDIYAENYDSFLLTGDFNAEECESVLSSFIFEYDAYCLVKEKTCFKNLNNPSCIDLFITNKKHSFQNTTTISTGASDYHKMVVTVLKITYIKSKPKEIFYRDYKNFNNEKFREELKLALSCSINSYTDFETQFLNVLNNNAPTKKKLLRANHKDYMTKNLRKAIMKRSELETKFYRTKNPVDQAAYKKQRNFVSRLYKRERKKYYNNLDIRKVTENRRFWETMKPLFSEKTDSREINNLLIDGKIVSEDGEIAENLNNYFANAVKSLEIQENRYLLIDTKHIPDPIDAAIKKYALHPSILKITEKVKASIFLFKEISVDEVEKYFKDLDPKKASTFNNIPPKLFKVNYDICGDIVAQLINKSIETSHFPNRLKLADLTPIHKCGDKTCQKNYRPISILPIFSKIYEKVIQTQINTFIEKYISHYMCGYRKGYNPQHALLTLIEYWKKSLDISEYSGVVFMDLSKAFDTINHDLLIAKLNAYGFDKTALKLLKSYLSNRWHRTKINTSFSSWREIECGVPQGSVLGPLLFNIYINDLFWVGEETGACGWADDISIHACDKSLESLILRLEHDSLLFIEWFDSNYMRLNVNKCHLLLSGYKHQWNWAMVGNEQIWESNTEKLLGVIIDKNLNFNDHANKICREAGKKVTALCRISRYLNFHKRKVLFKAFIQSQFAYCPLVWIFHSRCIENKINRLHERVLRIVYGDYTSDFKELLKKDESVTVHHKNIQLLAIEIFKHKNDISPPIMKNLFENRNYEGPRLRSQLDYQVPQINTVNYGENSLRYLGPKIWDIVPKYIKDLESLDKFKLAIKSWVPTNCPCRLCKNYINGVGFVNEV